MKEVVRHPTQVVEIDEKNPYGKVPWPPTNPLSRHHPTKMRSKWLLTLFGNEMQE